MNPRISISRTLLATAAGLGLAVQVHGQPEPTPISELVIYGLDGDFGTNGEGGSPGRLFRFVPGDNGAYQSIGPTVLASTGQELWDWEALAFVPGGPAMGLYAVPNDNQVGPAKFRLVKISMFDATCTIVGTEDLGNFRGATVIKNGAGEWRILGHRTAGPQSYLMVVNPATGAREPYPGWVLNGGTELEVNKRMWGLARDINGVLFGVTHQGNESQIWRIDMATGAATALSGGAANAPRVEALEFAFGDTTPAFSGLPAATAGWPFERGTLMGFADDNETMYVFNPETGLGVPLATIAGFPIDVPWTDVEGLVFLTKLQDPQSPIFAGFD